jgi:hypothetical protein
MAFGNLLNQVGERAKEASGLVAGLGDVAMDKVNEMIDQYKRVVGVLATFGFAVGKLDLDVGILPAIGTSIRGSIQAIREDEVKKIIAQHEGDPFLARLLGALLTAKRLSEQVNLKADEVVLQLTLGVNPSVQISLA